MHPAQGIVHAPGKVVYVTALDDDHEFGEHGRCDCVEDGFNGCKEICGGLLLSQVPEKEGWGLDLERSEDFKS